MRIHRSHRHNVLAGVCIGIAACLLTALAHAQTARPNILFVYTDDQAPWALGASGNSQAHTPNMDRLVAEGFSFRRNYCFGSNSGAVCVPSRAMMQSGKRWFDAKNDLSDAKILPELLKENGYVPFGTGKWHNGQKSWLRGFQHGEAIFFGGMSDHTKVPLVDLSEDGELVNKREDSFSSQLFADAAVKFLKGYKQDEPFYCYVPFTAPHDPRQPPVAYREMYYKDRPPLPANYLPQHPFDNGQTIGGRDENLAAWPRTKEVISDQLAEYYGLVTHLDEQIGRILKALEESGHAENTLIVYAADHGLAMGSHGLLGKQSVYEHSMRCPLIFVGPGVPKGEESEAFTYLYDIFPTVCGYAGVTPPEGIAGHNLRPVWDGKQKKVRDAVFLPFRDIQRSVRDDRWKLICYPKLSHFQLFDLENDPHEMKNLIDEDRHAREFERMFALLRNEQERTGDTLALPRKNKPAPKIDLTGRKRTPDRWQPDWIREKYFDVKKK